MRKLIATVFNYSLDGLLADEGTDFWTFCFELPENREPDDAAQLDFLRSAYAHVMGRTAYESIAGAMTTTATDHSFAPILNASPKVVFSRTRPTGRTPPSPLVTRQKRSTSSGGTATITSSSGAAFASGGRSCNST